MYLRNPALVLYRIKNVLTKEIHEPSRYVFSGNGKDTFLKADLEVDLMRHGVHLRSFVLAIAGYERNL